MNVFAPHAVREVLSEKLDLDGILNSFCGVTWREPDVKFAPVECESGRVANLSYRMIPLPGGPPLYAGTTAVGGVHSAAYQFRDEQTGGTLLVAPDVGALTPELLAALAESDAIVFDGTFWSRDELMAMKPGARTPEEMGHVTIADTSMALLAGLSARRKIYTHLNNTNPVLAAESPERKSVEAAGLTVGCDGLEFEI